LKRKNFDLKEGEKGGFEQSPKVKMEVNKMFRDPVLLLNFSYFMTY
jgi:hypothetical protein